MRAARVPLIAARRRRPLPTPGRARAARSSPRASRTTVRRVTRTAREEGTMALLSRLGLTPTVEVAKAIAASSGPDPKVAAQAALADFDKALKGAVAFAAQIKDKALQTQFVQALDTAPTRRSAPPPRRPADEQREAAREGAGRPDRGQGSRRQGDRRHLQGRGEEAAGPAAGDARPRLRRLDPSPGAAEGAVREARRRSTRRTRPGPRLEAAKGAVDKKVDEAHDAVDAGAVRPEGDRRLRVEAGRPGARSW